MLSDPIDPVLSAGLPPRAGVILREWAREIGAEYTHARWFTNGRSGAVVAAVLEETRAFGLRQVILKFDHGSGEFLAHVNALLESPSFAEKHITAAVREPLPIGDGTRFTFFQIAGGGFTDFGVLSALAPPGNILWQGSAEHPLAEVNETTFVAACATVVRSVLGEWTVTASSADQTVPDFMKAHLGDRLQRVPALRQLTMTKGRATIEVDGSEITNPFSLVLDPARTAGHLVKALHGRAHGDLQSENVLLPVQPAINAAGFRLIDLSKYSAEAPLSRDPVHLVLHTVARVLPGLTNEQRDGIMEILCDPRATRNDTVPRWLYDLVVEVREAGEDWAEGHGLIDLWRPQTMLSTVACAMMMYGRASTPADSRGWFLRLAGRATDAYLSGPIVRVRSRFAASDPGGSRGDGGWIERLCRSLPNLRRLAVAKDLTHDLEALVARARPGTDLTDQLEALANRLHGHAGRQSVDGGYQPQPASTYVCPLGLCPRTGAAQPDGHVPQCHLRQSDTPMRRCQR